MNYGRFGRNAMTAALFIALTSGCSELRLGDPPRSIRSLDPEIEELRVRGKQILADYQRQQEQQPAVDEVVTTDVEPAQPPRFTAAPRRVVPRDLARPPPRQFPAATAFPPEMPSSKIERGDHLVVEVWLKDRLGQLQGFPRRTVCNQDDGAIVLPFIGEIAAAGETPAELKAALEQRLLRILHDPLVVVAVVPDAAHVEFRDSPEDVGFGASDAPPPPPELPLLIAAPTEDPIDADPRPPPGPAKAGGTITVHVWLDGAAVQAAGYPAVIDDGVNRDQVTLPGLGPVDFVGRSDDEIRRLVAASFQSLGHDPYVIIETAGRAARRQTITAAIDDTTPRPGMAAPPQAAPPQAAPPPRPTSARITEAEWIDEAPLIDSSTIEVGDAVRIHAWDVRRGVQLDGFPVSLTNVTAQAVELPGVNGMHLANRTPDDVKTAMKAKLQIPAENVYIIVDVEKHGRPAP